MTFIQSAQTQAPPAQVQWDVGAYVRLSKEDGDKQESDSIQNQQRIIENHLAHLRQQGECIRFVEVFSDDGYAGGSFQRPAYRRMIAAVEAGAINCIVCKDLSRLGRNYPELGKLMEEYFPQKGIRVISVVNSLDSVRSPESYGSAIVSFSNMVNDDYIRQLSVKIKCTLDMKRERGEFLGNYAPYGYVKSPQERHHLAIDPEAAAVVRNIFSWYSAGATASGIVKQLNALGVPPPSVYKARQGCKGFLHHSGGGVKSNAWALSTVNAILKDEVYIGNLVQGKRRSESYRTKKMVRTEEARWTVMEGAHEAIVTDAQFIAVHERFVRRTRVPTGEAEPHLLSGYVYCAHCGRRMSRYADRGKGRYRCPTRTYAPARCQCPSIAEARLRELVLAAVQRQLACLADPTAVLAAARRESADDPRPACAAALGQASQEKERLATAKFRLYDNFQRGTVTESDFHQFNDRYTQEIARQETHIRQLSATLTSWQSARRQNDEFVSYFTQHGTIPHLNAFAMRRLIDRIEVQDSQHFAIYFKCAPDSSGAAAPPDTAEGPIFAQAPCRQAPLL